MTMSMLSQFFLKQTLIANNYQCLYLVICMSLIHQISTQVISSDLKGKGNTYYLKKERWLKDSRYHRKISRICVDKELKTTMDLDYKPSHLAVVELERSFPGMDNFHSPLWSQPNQIFYPQDGIKNGKKGKM